ncbi:MAG: invasion associated locus B family protein [Magnetococcales bacterium]|nr:invasion associated locus B family protein [Magnetococcales bacterium]
MPFFQIFSASLSFADSVDEIKKEGTLEQKLDGFIKNTKSIESQRWGEETLPLYSRSYILRYFDDWEIECIDGHGCVTAHNVYLDNGRQLMRLSVKINENGDPPLITLELPLGFYLPDQVRMYLGTNTVYHKFTVQHCVGQVCVAFADNASRLISVISENEHDRAAIVLQKLDRSKLFVINFSRLGFSKAYVYLKTGEDKQWHD